MKVPKVLRKSGIVQAFAGNEAAQKVLADALIAAAGGTAAAVLTRKLPTTSRIADASEAVVDPASRAASATTGVVKMAASALGHAVTGIASSLVSHDPDTQSKEEA